VPGVVPGFLATVDRERSELRKVKSPQLHSKTRRDALRAMVEHYFNDIRPRIIGPSEQDEDVADIDDAMQELLQLCHKKGSIRSYSSLLARIRRQLICVDARMVASAALDEEPQLGDAVDMSIVQTLRELVPSAALSYEQALDDLQAESRKSWRGPATDLRECLRETLDRLAPDDDVMAMPGYKQNPDVNGPTMRQKVRYVLKSRGQSKTASESAETATETVDQTVGSFVRSVYTRSSVSTHTPTDRAEVVRIRDYVRVVLCELLEIST
jgi:hypothetical protein